MSYRGVRPSLPMSSQLSQFRSARLGVTTYDLNFGRSSLLRPNSVSGVLGIYGKAIESTIYLYMAVKIGTHIKLLKSIVTKTTSMHK